VPDSVVGADAPPAAPGDALASENAYRRSHDVAPATRLAGW
jgi:hypothetical protein